MHETNMNVHTEGKFQSNAVILCLIVCFLNTYNKKKKKKKNKNGPVTSWIDEEMYSLYMEIWHIQKLYVLHSNLS